MGYGKTFESTFTGSMVGIGPTTFSVWFYCIASCKPPGLVELNPVLLAVIIGCSEQEIEDAIQTLSNPDPRSRNKDEDGRRLIREGQFLFRMPSWPKYNAIRNEEQRRASNREAARQYRVRQSAPSAASSDDGDDVDDDQQNQPTEMQSTAAAAAAAEPPLPPSGGQEIRWAGAPEKATEPPTTRIKLAERPQDVTDDLWRDFVAYRRSKRAPLTERVLKATRASCAKEGMTLTEGLEYWIASGHTGFFPRGVNKRPNPAAASHAIPTIRHNSALDLGDPGCDCLSCRAQRRDQDASDE